MKRVKKRQVKKDVRVIRRKFKGGIFGYLNSKPRIRHLRRTIRSNKSDPYWHEALWHFTPIGISPLDYIAKGART